MTIDIVEYIMNQYSERISNPLIFQNKLSTILMDPVNIMKIRERLFVEKINGNPRLTLALKELAKINMYKKMIIKNFPEFEIKPQCISEEKNQTSIENQKIKTIGGIKKWFL